MTCMSCKLFLYVLLLLGARGRASPEASAPGDIIIGGIFPFHDKVEEYTSLLPPPSTLAKCKRFNAYVLGNSLALINTVEQVNQSPPLSTLGLSLGYRLRDTCSDVTTALGVVDTFRREGGGANASGSAQPVTAVIGAYSSEISIAVARQLNLELIPQISYASTATILSDKTRFPGFLRTVPSDLYQTQAMVRLISDNGWDWVGVVVTDGDYGLSALNTLLSHASKRGICVAFQEVLPLAGPEYPSAVRRVAGVIRNSPNVKVVVSFVSPEHMNHLFQELSKPEEVSISRVWLASDSWSTLPNTVLSGSLKLKSVGQVVGFKFKQGSLTSFRGYLRRLAVTEPEDRQHNPFLKKFLAENNSVGSLLQMIQADQVFSLEMSVRALAEAVATVCRGRNCSLPGTLQPREILRVLREGVTFTQDGRSYSFNKSGDIDLGYDITIWKSEEGEVHVGDVVAVYHPSNNSFTHTHLPSGAGLKHLMEIRSRCSATCHPGQIKQTSEDQLHTCCYDCINCTENHYSNGTDMVQCQACHPDTEWSPEGSSGCRPKTIEFFSWDDGFAVVLLTLAGLGILLCLLVGALFLRHRQTPVVKAAGGALCQVILLSLIGSFVSAVVFVGEPSDVGCRVRQVLFGLSFTLCVSCILVKSLKILLAFQFNPAMGRLFRKLYQPHTILCGCLSLQVVTCLVWLLALTSPHMRRAVLSTSVLIECDVGSVEAFTVMLVYIAILALVCFVCAFKGRKLPQKYNEAKFITFGMLLYLISWVIFVPVYVTTSGKYLPAVEMVVILISSYGVLCCHFLPKCYIILFRKEHNTKDAFIKSVHEYSNRGLDKVSITESASSMEQYTSPPFTVSLPSISLPQPTAPPVPPQGLGGSPGMVSQNRDKVPQGQLDRRAPLARCFSI